MCDTNAIIIDTIPTYQEGYQVSPTADPVDLTQQPILFPSTYGNFCDNPYTLLEWHINKLKQQLIKCDFTREIIIIN